MNRRNVIKLLAALLPCAIVARMLGEKDLHGTPSPIPNYAKAPYIPEQFFPRTGFHTEIHELGVRYTETGERLEPCFRAVIRDCSGSHSIMAIQSPVFFEGDTKFRRYALDFLYKNITHVIRRRQFPKDTLIYDTEITVNGVKLMNPRYPK